MADIKPNDVERGSYLLMKNEPYQVIDKEFVNPGKGSSFFRFKLKHLTNGRNLAETQKTSDTLQTADVSDLNCQFLGVEESSQTAQFMDLIDYNTFEISFDVLGDKRFFLLATENGGPQHYQVIFFNSVAVDIKLPPKMDLFVTEAEIAVKGDTATNVTKQVTMETGLKVRVPIFINVGDKLRINSDTSEYAERVSK